MKISRRKTFLLIFNLCFFSPGGVRADRPQRVADGHDEEGLHAAPPGGQVRQLEGEQLAAGEERDAGRRRRRGQERRHAAARRGALRPPERRPAAVGQGWEILISFVPNFIEFFTSPRSYSFVGKSLVTAGLVVGCITWLRYVINISN